MRLTKYLMAFVLSALLPLGAAHAQRGSGGGGDNWDFLGKKTGGIGVEGDSIVINQNEDWHRDRGFDKLKFAAEGGDIDLLDLRIRYMNGHTEEIRVDRQIRRGAELIIDLPGTRSFLRQIDMRYRTNSGISIGRGGIRFDSGAISVSGLRARPASRPALAAVDQAPIARVSGWKVMDSQEVAGRDDLVTFQGTRRGGDGRVGQIRLKAERGEVEVRSMVVRFRNGETQHIRVDKMLDDGQASRPYDLEGDQRAIDSVVVNLEPSRGGRGRGRERAELALYGASAAGQTLARGTDTSDPYAVRGWTLIGEQRVGFLNDRDRIEVGQNDDWHRRNRFSQLFFVALGNDIYMNSVRLIYQNGYAEDLRIDQTIREGTDFRLPLQGERSHIRTIEMNYRSRPGFSGQATMRVYGDPSRR